MIAALVKPTRDEYIAHVSAAFVGSSRTYARGLIVSVAADVIDALVADATARGLAVLEVINNGDRAQAQIGLFRRRPLLSSGRGYSREFTPNDATAKNYLLARIPARLWVTARAKAKRDGLSMRGLLLNLLTQYVEGA